MVLIVGNFYETTSLISRRFFLRENDKTPEPNNIVFDLLRT